MTTQDQRGKWTASASGADSGNFTETIYLNGDSRTGYITITMPAIEQNYEVIKANAALIAAAPELLESCKMLIHAVEHEMEPHGRIVDGIINARAAIAKAGGGE